MTESGESPAAPPDRAFLAGGGEMGERMRSRDWTGFTLGPPERWPQSLRTAIGILLNSKFPMFLAWGPELRFFYNDGYVPILGDKHPAALAERFEDIWTEIWEEISPIVDRAMAGEATYWENLGLTMTRKGYPEQTWFTFSYSPVRDDAGAVAGMLCVCTETTEIVQSEQRRIDEAERLRLLFAKAPGFIAVLRGPDHVFELANESYLQLIGNRNVVGKPLREALPEVEGQGFLQLLSEVYGSGRAFTGTGVKVSLSRSHDGTAQDRWLDFVYQPIIDADGSVGGIFVEGYDVTERHAAEQALRESEERFRLIADSAPVPMWVTKRDRTRGFVNIAYAEFLGVPYAEALHFDWRRIVHPDDQERLISESLAGEASQQPFRLEARYRRGDGQWRWLRSESQPRWGPNGEHIGFIGVASDITESKLAEDALREVNETLEGRVAERTADLSAALAQLQAEAQERARAEEALRQAQKMDAVGRLTGGIAHDFNNLLTPIVGGLQLIASRVDDARLKRLADGALESARRGTKLTGQLLAFSRVQRIAMRPVAVNRVVANMRELLGHAIGGAIRVELALDDAAGHAISDANQLENALLNLAINARDAMPGGGTLTIATGREASTDAVDLAAGDYVRVSVSDTGEGMAPDVLARATEPFFSTKPLGKGTGLGLAQVYGIAQQSGGTLRIDSTPGGGTAVHMLLPAASDSDALADDELGIGSPEPRQPLNAATILVVDDDANVRAFLWDSLEALGYQVVLAESGREGLDCLAKTAPDLVLLDYAMPEMNGAEVARKIRLGYPALPILFVTGYAETGQLEQAVGPDFEVLRKPFTVGQLDAAVAAHLRASFAAAP